MDEEGGVKNEGCVGNEEGLRAELMRLRLVVGARLNEHMGSLSHDHVFMSYLETYRRESSLMYKQHLCKFFAVTKSMLLS